MKVALVSVHSDPNYGSMLQAYALSAALNKLGCENEYINYVAFDKQSLVVIFGKRIFKRILEVLRVVKPRRTEYSYWSTDEFKDQLTLFHDFHDKYISSSAKKYFKDTIEETNEVYSKFIVGSDQTWSPLVAQSKYSINFLSFVTDSTKKCAYAPSFGTLDICAKYLQSIKGYLSDFAFLSCREKMNAIRLTSYLSKNVEHVLDPTFLLSRTEWLQLSEPINMPNSYVLCYVLGTKKKIYDYATKLAQEKEIPLYIIAIRPEYLNYSNALKNVTVKQFISLIYSATYVVTDSFHGSLFSIILGTNFYAFTKREQIVDMNDNDRISDFLGTIGLSNRLKNDDDNEFESDICFSDVYKILDPMRDASLNYLKRLLS